MNDREQAKKGIELAALVISANQTRNRSKLDKIELERQDVMVNAARGILKDSEGYVPSDDQAYFE